MSPTRDAAVLLAMKDLDSGVFQSVRAAAKAHGLNESLIRSRRKNHSGTHTEAAKAKRLLLEWQEDLLARWILETEKNGHHLTHQQIKDFANFMSKNAGGPKCGHNWVPRFIARRPDLRTKLGKRSDIPTTQDANSA